MDRAPFHPTALRTEYRIDPLGVDTPEPRLCWVLESEATRERGLRQSAYHVLVASEREALVPGRADLWDSGAVASEETAHVAYAGRTLRVRQQCWWAVRSADQRGRWSDWSEPATWTMGLLTPDAWQARWIGTGESLEFTDPPKACPNTLADAWLRREFILDRPVRRATAFVASVGFHELYVNGTKIGDAVLVPNVTDNSKRARYAAYEIGAQLRPGANAVGLWLGTGWSIFSKFATADKPRAPIALGQFEFDFDSGASSRLITDDTWKTHPSPSSLLGSWDFRDFGGERYDASREIAGWADPGLDERAWQPAAVFSPRLSVSSDCAEPNRCVTGLRPVAVEPEGEAFRFDMGTNFAGFIELNLAGRVGDRIEILFSERADKADTYGLRSEYVFGPSGAGVFRSRFNYGVGRWISVRGLRQPPKLADLRGWLVRPDYTPAAAFTCSAPLLNQIFDTAVWTFENLTLSGYVVDCPHRERMGYGGDAHATTTTGLTAFSLGAFYTKWSEDWRDVQGRTPTWGIGIPPGQAGHGGHEEGNLPYTAPTYWGGGGPAWSGYCVHLPWEVYRRYGDERILHANFTTIERWLAFLETKAEGQLLGRYGGLWDFLGDWLWPGAMQVNGDTREALFFNNCYWIYNLQIAAAIAAIVGRPAMQKAWTARAEQLRRAVHAEFFNPRDASYVNGFQAYLAMALLVNVPPPAVRASVWQRLEYEILEVRTGHIHAGITGGAFLFQLLMEAGRDDLIYAMVNRDDSPSWGAMLELGATTFWETWGSDADSRLHSSFLFVGAWFVHGVLGLRLDREIPGFKRFVVRPGASGQPGLEWAQGHYDSIRGRISVRWQKHPNAFELDVTVPPTTEAVVCLPCSEGEHLEESGRPVHGAPGILAVRREQNHTAIEVASGTYRFRCWCPAGGVEYGDLGNDMIASCGSRQR